MWELYEIQMSVYLKFYWNRATHIDLCIDSGYFPATTAMLSGRNRDLMVGKT